MIVFDSYQNYHEKGMTGIPILIVQMSKLRLHMTQLIDQRVVTRTQGFWCVFLEPSKIHFCKKF